MDEGTPLVQRSFRTGKIKREKDYAIDSEEKCIGGRFGGGFDDDGGRVLEHVRPVRRATGG